MNKNIKGTDKLTGKQHDVIALMRDEIATECAAIKAGQPARAHIASGADNKKTGALVDSYSTAPVITCAGYCEGCYAVKMAALRANVRKSYARNTAAMIEDRERTFNLIKWHATGRRFFRWHVSGDIMDADYFTKMVDVANACPGCTFLAFTGRYGIVNDYLNGGGVIPGNLVVLFSMPLCMVDVETFNKTCNPHKMPVTVVYEDAEDVRDNWNACGGDCSACACHGVGCWTMKRGDVIAIKKH